MAEPLKGGQQFFSNYLKAFGETVDKLTELVEVTEQTIPKFAELSDNVKHQRTLNEEVLGMGSGDKLLTTVVPWVSGKIRLKVKGKITSAGGTDKVSLRVTINGVLVSSTIEINSTDMQTVNLDLNVKEEDSIVITLRSSAGVVVLVEEISACFDLVTKPYVTL